MNRTGTTFAEAYPAWRNGFPQREDYDGEAAYLADCEQWDADHDAWEDAQ